MKLQPQDNARALNKLDIRASERETIKESLMGNIQRLAPSGSVIGWWTTTLTCRRLTAAFWSLVWACMASARPPCLCLQTDATHR